MNYIILDLEWDGAYFPKINRFINQILQVGAVKLNENFDVIETFDVIIKSSFSKRVSKRFSELTGITKEDMLKGVSLESAFKAYNKWANDTDITMTWSNSDIYTVLENEKHLLDGIKLKINKYLDLQKFIQGEMQLSGIECTSQISLLNAAVAFGINVDESLLHNAKADSTVAAELLKKCYNKERFSTFVLDTSDPEFFERYIFKPYYISDINDKDIDKSQFEFCCTACGSPLVLKGKWRQRFGGFSACLICNACRKKYFANVKFRKMFDSVKVRRRLSEKIKNKANNNDM